MSPKRRQALIFLLALQLVAVLGVVLLYAQGFVPLRAPDAARFPFQGIDVSHHQGEIDWEAVRGDGIRFTLIKATEGGDFLDPRFSENWEAAGRAGVPRGAYHFFTFCTPGRTQAEHFLDTLAPGAGELAPVVDVEFTGNCLAWESIEGIREELTTFIGIVRERDGREPVIYLNRASFKRIVRGHFFGAPLWVRDLLFEPAAAQYSSYGGWRYWQYDDSGSVAGIRGPVDRNVFSGDATSFETLLR